VCTPGLRTDQQTLAVHAAGHRAGKQTADNNRHALNQPQQTDLRVGERHLIDLPRHGDVADHGVGPELNWLAKSLRNAVSACPAGPHCAQTRLGAADNQRKRRRMAPRMVLNPGR